MGYLAKALAGGEAIVYRARFNWTYDVGPLFWLALGLTPLLLELASIAGGQGSLAHQSYFYRLLAGISFVLGTSLWLSKMIRKWTTQIVVTSSRFIFKRGLIAREAHEVDLDHIEEVALKQTFWGRLLGFGNVMVRGTGIGLIELPALDRPLRVQRMIEEAQQELRRSARAEAA
jgi:hypothetical protein